MKQNNIAYIDGANLHKGVDGLGWKLDYQRFRTWLKDKYSVQQAFIFLGMVPEYARLYEYLQRVGFILIFKEVVYSGDGNVKGNCDADLVFEVTKSFFEKSYDQAIIVSSDGDYARLISFLYNNKRLRILLSPSNKCSVLLYRTGAPITFLDQVKSYVELKKKKPPLQTKP